MRKVLLLVSIVMLLLVVMAIPAFAEPAPMVDVCHYDSDTYAWVLINVNDNAWDAHAAHGDAHPGDNVPNMPGYTFDDSCNPESSGPPAGCYANTYDDLDIAYNGTPDVLGNVIFYDSLEGRCGGEPFATGTLVIADSAPEADALCTAVGSYSYEITWQEAGWSGLPANAWVCIP